MAGRSPLEISPDKLLGDLEQTSTETPLDGGKRYVARSRDDGIRYHLPKGDLEDADYVAFDVLIDNPRSARFELILKERSSGKVHEIVSDFLGIVENSSFVMLYDVLGNCQSRVRMPLDAVKYNRMYLQREGGWQYPRCGGDEVDLAEIDTLEVRVYRMNELDRLEFSQTPILVGDESSVPPTIDEPHLPEGPLVDEFGQHNHISRPHSIATESQLKEHLLRESEAEGEWPEQFSKWGGDGNEQLRATGYFRVEETDDRWVFVDPDGHPFFSSGSSGVAPRIRSITDDLENAYEWLPAEGSEFDDAHRTETNRDATFHGDSEPWVAQVDFLIANYIRAFGPDEWEDEWKSITERKLRRMGFNTIGAFSDCELLSRTVPYTRLLELEFPNSGYIFRDFPDVFDEGFETDVREIAAQLESTAADPYMLGYFLDNEPGWAWTDDNPVEMMLKNDPDCASRARFVAYLREKYATASNLSDSWGERVSFDRVESGVWNTLPNGAKEDTRYFSSVMTEAYLGRLCAACREVDPNHLVLGVRYVGPLLKWVEPAVQHFDVFSLNWYGEKPPGEKMATISERLSMPILIGEYGFGTGNLTGIPLCQVNDQHARGMAFRRYIETAANERWCVGVHQFKYYDDPPLGDILGENADYGLSNTYDETPEEVEAALRESHSRLYDIVNRDEPPISDGPSIENNF